MEKAFINKVESSGIIAFDILEYVPDDTILGFDIKSLLKNEIMVIEKDFRALLHTIDFFSLKNQRIAVYCSVDAIIPSWAFMSIAAVLESVCADFDFTDPVSMKLELWKRNIEKADLKKYEGKKVVVRARTDIHPSLYLLVTKRLKSIVSTLMYGEIGMPKVIVKNS